MKKNPYRTHNLGELRKEHVGEVVKLSGWVHRKRNHGQLMFVDLRDNFGITQIVVDSDSEYFDLLEKVRLESVITVNGIVVARTDETINKELLTGEIEIKLEKVKIESQSLVLPFQIAVEENCPEDLRLKYRFLDLRREKLHNNILLRNDVVSFLRKKMWDLGFKEFQTPILTASSPEGARDYLVPSRQHPGKFYALPQAPQQFKQLLMVSGFDRYFQIAPCFRDEDSRADRSPGEFYQLDFEMSFVTQEDVFEVLEEVLYDTFKNFSNFEVSEKPFTRIPYREAMLKYGSDKPDLRNPLIISDVSEAFVGSDFSMFAKIVENGGVVRAIPAPKTADKPRSFFDKLNEWARNEGQGGLGYLIFAEDGAKGPIASKLNNDRIEKIKNSTGAKNGDSVFFVAGKGDKTVKFSGLARDRIAQELELIAQNKFEFCLVVDFPMYELNEDTNQIEFSHNPFSMPQGGLEALENMNPLDILAYQYDIVCNGIELSSGAIRNHLPEIMFKAFEIAGYDAETVETKFGGMLNAFRYGAPPHGGSAPGVDRMVMLLAQEPNIREVIAFPLNQRAEDLLMNAPATVEDIRLRELQIKHVKPEAKSGIKVVSN